MKTSRSDKSFEYFQKSIYTAICSQYVEIWDGATEDSFVKEIFGPMVNWPVSGDRFVTECRAKNSLMRRDQVLIACAYLAESIKAKAFGRVHLAWTYLMDAQRFASMAVYANQLRKEMPSLEAEAAADALKSSKRKGGQVTNESNRLIGDRAVALIKAKAKLGKPWAKYRDAVREIQPELWPFMLEIDPTRSKANYERSVIGHVKERSQEVAQFFTNEKPRIGLK